jgi:hypothetical protein
MRSNAMHRIPLDALPALRGRLRILRSAVSAGHARSPKAYFNAPPKLEKDTPQKKEL